MIKREVPKRMAKYYSPDAQIVRHMKRRLRLAEELQRISAEEQVSEELEHEKGALSTDKTRILEKVFQAMADLTFFFGAVGKHPEIQKVFDDDIKEILGVKRTDPKKVPYGFMFITLIAGMLSVQFKTGKDFRLRLNELLHYIIKSKIAAYQSDIFKSAAIQGIIGQDYNRVLGWAEMLTFAVGNEGEEYRIPTVVPVNRKSGPTKLEKKFMEEQRERYFKDIKQKSPWRTFNYDPMSGQVK